MSSPIRLTSSAAVLHKIAMAPTVVWMAFAITGGPGRSAANAGVPVGAL
jgi:hypothetical protein